MISDERVQIALEELQDLKGVWNELLKIWEKIDELKEQPWLSVQPRKVRHGQSNLSGSYNREYIILCVLNFCHVCPEFCYVCPKFCYENIFPFTVCVKMGVLIAF